MIKSNPKLNSGKCEEIGDGITQGKSDEERLISRSILDTLRLISRKVRYPIEKKGKGHGPLLQQSQILKHEIFGKHIFKSAALGF